MELVEGVSLVEFVRGTVARGAGARSKKESADASCLSEQTSAVEDTEALIARIRVVLIQLTEALAALHAAGMVHRDLKPSNVLVTKEGRVVVLDFGLVALVGRRGTSLNSKALGTPHYVSPEQLRGEPATYASDLYALGVILYEVLVGETPFRGMSPLSAVKAKCEGEVHDPRRVVPSIPDDLAELCVALLSFDPKARPSPVQIRASLFGGDMATLAERNVNRPSSSLIGRDEELEFLRRAYARALRAGSELVVLEGESGMGKSALADAFLSSLEKTGGAFVLRGRCFERDALPNKLIDSVVDALSAHLARLEDSIVRELLPKEIAELYRMFPVLGRVDEIADASPLSGMRENTREARRYAELAFAELVHRIAKSRPVVIAIDDVHWADVESLGFLCALLDPRIESRVMVLLAWRTEDKLDSPFVHGLESAFRRDEIVCPQLLRVERLEENEASSLALALCGYAWEAELITQLAREGRGHPLFIEELVRFTISARSTREDTEEGRSSRTEIDVLSLADVIVGRVRGFEDEAVRLLEALALIGVPVSARVAFRAIGADAPDERLLHRLRAAHLVRGSASLEDDHIVCYHDRVRESLAQNLGTAERIALHGRIADALSLEPEIPVALFAVHLHEAGRSERAAEQAMLAAERARATLAFGEAASFYRRAREWDPRNEERRTLAAERLGEALYELGRCREAADALLDAARERAVLSPQLATRLRTRAAEALLIAGDGDRGVPMIRALLDEVGVSFPRSALTTRARIAWNFFRIGRMVSTPTVSKTAPDAVTSERIDVLFAAHRSLLFRDFPRAMVFGMEGFREAIGVGDADGIVEGLSFYATGSSLAQARGAKEIVRSCFDLAERLESDRAYGFAHLARTFEHLAQMRMREAYSHSRRAVEHLGRCDGVASTRIHAQETEILLLRYLEDLDELRLRTDEVARIARSLGNAYVEAVAELDASVVELGADRPERALHAIDGACESVSKDDLLVVYSAIHCRTKCRRYVGDWDLAVAELDQAWTKLQTREILTSRLGRVTFGGLRLGSIVGLALHEPKKREPLLRRARKGMSLFRSASSDYALGYRTLLEASILAVSGANESAHEECLRASAIFERGGFHVFAATSRYRAAQLARDADGVARAACELGELSVLNARSWADSVAPGFP